MMAGKSCRQSVSCIQQTASLGFRDSIAEFARGIEPKFDRFLGVLGLRFAARVL